MLTYGFMMITILIFSVVLMADGSTTMKNLCLHHCREKTKFCQSEIIGKMDGFQNTLLSMRQCNEEQTECLTLCKKQSFQECVSTCAAHVRDCFKQKDLAKVSSCMKTRREDCIKKECELKRSLIVPNYKKDHSSLKTTTRMSNYKT
uniref:Uncharacterized protein n=1 Tax=Clytia hemisphaerica TaxID=252671 RepID=A0A7M5UYK4_9CNID|eukprot:TCONS_00072339-protein